MSMEAIGSRGYHSFCPDMPQNLMHQFLLMKIGLLALEIHVYFFEFEDDDGRRKQEYWNTASSLESSANQR